MIFVFCGKSGELYSTLDTDTPEARETLLANARAYSATNAFGEPVEPKNYRLEQVADESETDAYDLVLVECA